MRDHGLLFIQTYGKAARTLPTEEHVGFAYVFETDDGLWAINGHQEAHSTDLPTWHAERILADGVCIQAIDVESERPLIIAGTKVMVKDTGVTEIFSVSTVEFHLLVDERDNPPLREFVGSLQVPSVLGGLGAARGGMTIRNLLR